MIGKRLAIIVMAVLTLSLGVLVPSAYAWWKDNTAGGTATATAYTVPAPTVSCGALGIGSVKINWTQVAGATGYVVHYGSGGGSNTTVGASTTSQTYSGLATIGTFSVQAQINYGSTTWTSATSNSVSYQVILFAAGICNVLPLG